MEERVSIAEAKRRLSDLLGRVAYAGKTIQITKRGRPIARIVPMQPPEGDPFQDWHGWLSDDDPFFEIIGEIVASRRKHHPRSVRR